MLCSRAWPRLLAAGQYVHDDHSRSPTGSVTWQPSRRPWIVVNVAMKEGGQNRRSVRNGVAFIGRILLLGFVLAVSVVGSRLFNHGGGVAVANLNINVPANYIWIFFAALTLAHYLYASSLSQSIVRFWDSEESTDRRRSLFEKITSDPNLFVFGLIPRSKPIKPGSRRYRMDGSDPSTWITILAMSVFVISMLPWYVTATGSLKWSTGWTLFIPLAAALMLGIANWLVGGIWLILLSQLTVEKCDAESIKREKARMVQSVYGRVLRLGKGKSLMEVKDLLAREWRSTFGTNITDPELSEAAEKLAKGQRIKVVLRMKS